MPTAPAILQATSPIAGGTRAQLSCSHCGAPCTPRDISDGVHTFCCNGCRVVFHLLHDSGLGRFYTLETTPGIRMAENVQPGRFAYLDGDSVRERIVDFADEREMRVTFHIPAMHCIACVWLLENLFRLNPAIGRSQVNFPRKEVAISFDHRRLPLSGMVELLASIGYEPTLNLGTGRTEAQGAAINRPLWLKIGLAGFAFGNIMLLSLPSYFGLHAGDSFRPFFGWLSFGLAVPVLLYSASDYWRAAWLGLRRRMLTIDFPIALGIAALFAQSFYDVATRTGEGFFDSFSGLVFLLLCGKWFQQKSFDALSFDRDYRSYFPLSAIRRDAGRDTAVPLAELRVGDRILVRHRELVPADARIVHGPALIDYSFVTGESTPVGRRTGDYVYAGGRQVGGAIEVETVKATSQSYLTSLWNHEAFRKNRDRSLYSLTNRAGRWFTVAVLLIAAGAAGGWLFRDAAMAARVFAATLIVACPCALALSAPFTLGAATRLLGRARLYVRNADVVESMAHVNALVLDKTGTLTNAGAQTRFEGDPLSEEARAAIQAVAAHSTHPLSCAIAGGGDGTRPDVADFCEAEGRGVAGVAGGHRILLGSPAWLRENGIATSGESAGVQVAIDGCFRGTFVAAPAYRTDVAALAARLAEICDLALLSGDSAREEAELRAALGDAAVVRFNQSPSDKLEAVDALQQRDRRVMMVGDGLNDAGALKQSDVGVAITDRVASFTPACDAILDARALALLPRFLVFSRRAVRVIYASFAISVAYNVVGLTFAARGLLSPLVSAVLMPLSSVSVIAFALTATRWAAKRSGLA